MKPPSPYRKIVRAIVHCSDTPPDWLEGATARDKRDEIRRWHIIERRWSDIGYHFVVDRDGQIAVGRCLSVPGAHCMGQNSDSVGICLVGGLGSKRTDSFLDNFTVEQDFALRQLLRELGEANNFDWESDTHGHNDYDKGKECPGFNVADWLASSVRKESLLSQWVDAARKRWLS